ncbi:unnamed protein product [Absidia cylindrospora]
MVLKSTLLLSLAVVQMALASTVTIVSPKAKDVRHAGQVVEFKWTGEASTNTTGKGQSKQKVNHNGKLSIALATGPAQSLVIDCVIASNVNLTKGSYKWKIPKNINTTKKYVIEIGPNASDIAFAGYVSIVKAPKSSNSTAKPTSSAKPTKTSAPVKPTHTVITTTTPTNKHEPTAVCVTVPNKTGGGVTVKCHPKPKKSSHSSKKASSAKATKKPSSSKTTKSASPHKSSSTSKSYQHHSTSKAPVASDPTPLI